MSYFAGWDPQDIAQLYFHPFDPTDAGICEKYYRFSDLDAVKSVLDRRVVGRRFTKHEIRPQEEGRRTGRGLVGRAYAVGARHRAWSAPARDFIWRVSNWKNRALLDWVEDFAPDVLFFAAGDCKFSYRIAYWLAQELNRPLVTLCVDDYYIHNRNEGELFGRYRYRSFMETAQRVLNRSSLVLTICDSMKREYESRFGLNCEVLHTAAPCRQLDFVEKAFRVAYFGNLEHSRDRQLARIGRAVVNTKEKTGLSAVDVYSGSASTEQAACLQRADGVRFNGPISPSEVLERMRECIAVIHTEAFDEREKEQVRFSVSTKIAESLMYGPCLIAYGPEDVASIAYLKKNRAAYVITRPEDLEKGLEEILGNRELRERIVKNARALAAKNHSGDVTPKRIRMWLEQVVKGFGAYRGNR